MRRATRQFVGPKGFDDLDQYIVNRRLKETLSASARLLQTLGTIAAAQEGQAISLMLLADTVPAGDEVASIKRLLDKMQPYANRKEVDISSLPAGVLLTTWQPGHGADAVPEPEFRVNGQSHMLPEGYSKCRTIGFLSADMAGVTAGTVTPSGLVRQMTITGHAL